MTMTKKITVYDHPFSDSRGVGLLDAYSIVGEGPWLCVELPISGYPGEGLNSREARRPRYRPILRCSRFG